MFQPVTKESLNALAALAFQGIKYENDDPARPVDNLDEAGACLYHLLKDEGDLDFASDDHRLFANAFSEGTVFGLAVAAAIVSNGLNSTATMETVRAELREPKRYWPDKVSQKVA
jgi:hypothetical protein